MRSRATMFFDGGCRRNPPSICAAGAAVIYDYDETELIACARFLSGQSTVNIAEYTGLILGLEKALELGIVDLQVFGDSELIVRQVRGVYQVRKDHLLPLRNRAWELIRQFDRCAIYETPTGSTGRRRDNNKRADELAGMAMNQRDDLTIYFPRGGEMMETPNPSQGEETGEKLEEASHEERGFAEDETPPATPDTPETTEQGGDAGQGSEDPDPGQQPAEEPNPASSLAGTPAEQGDAEAAEQSGTDPTDEG